MFPVLRSFLHNRRLLWDFVKRDLRARYVGSSMGFFWSLIFPVINLVVYHFVFRTVLNTRWSDSQGATEVALVMLAGIVVWQAFAETLTRSTSSLIDNSNLIQKVVFPSELLPAFLVKSSLINMMIGVPILLIAVSWFGFVAVPKSYIHVPHETVQHEDGSVTQERIPVVQHEQGGILRVPIAIERGYQGDVRVTLEYAGTAELGQDFLGPTEILLPATAAGVDLLLQPLPDGEVEGDEEIIVRIVSAEPGGLAAMGGIPQVQHEFRATLLDDPAPAPGTAPSFAGGSESRMRDGGYQALSLSVSLVMVPVMLLLQFIFTLSLAYFLSVLNVFMRDTQHLVGVGVVVWMFCTPIFYPAEMVVKAGYGWLMTINPMHWIIDSWRQILLFGAWPDPFLLLRTGVLSVILLAISGRFFFSQKARIPDLL